MEEEEALRDEEAEMEARKDVEAAWVKHYFALVDMWNKFGFSPCLPEKRVE